MNGIFIESSEQLGLLYNRYKDIPDITRKFIDSVMDSFDTNGDKDTETVDEKLETFKRTIRGIIKTPEPINPRTIKQERKRVNSVREKVDTCLYQLTKLFDKYHAAKSNTGEQFPMVKSAIICARKVIIDTFNMCDQDINLLSLVDRVYYRKIYESDLEHILSDDCEDIMECDLSETQDDDIFSSIYEGYMESSNDVGGGGEQTENWDDITSEVSKNSDKDYHPMLAMAVSYRFGESLYTFMGPIIHGVTNGDEYTHAFFSLDPEIKSIITFGGAGLEYMAVSDYEAFKYSKSVYISVIWLTTDEMNDVRRTIKEYHDNPSDVRFSLVNFFTMMLGKVKRKDKSHCCSAFLGYLLNVANKKNLTKDYSQTRPEDITILPRAYYVGTFKDLEDLKKKRPEFKRRIQQIYDDNIDDIREYNNSIPRIMLADNIKRHKNLKSFYKRIVNRE